MTGTKRSQLAVGQLGLEFTILTQLWDIHDRRSELTAPIWVRMVLNFSGRSAATAVETLHTMESSHHSQLEHLRDNIEKIYTYWTLSTATLDDDSDYAEGHFRLDPRELGSTRDKLRADSLIIGVARERAISICRNVVGSSSDGTSPGGMERGGRSERNSRIPPRFLPSRVVPPLTK